MKQLVAPAHHAVFNISVTFGLRLTCRTGLHIGSGANTAMTPGELPIIRDGSGRPLIPGSSLRGVLRSGLEALAQSTGLAQKLPAERGAEPENEDQKRFLAFWLTLDPVARLFGAIAPHQKGERRDRDRSHAYGSRVQFSDLVCQDSSPHIDLRDGVAISRETRTASGGGLFAYEVVDAGTRFAGSVRLLNPEPFEVGLVAQSLWMLDQGMLLLGGKKARGLGWVQVETTSPFQVTAREILQIKSAPKEKDFGPVSQRLAQPIESLGALWQTADQGEN